MKYKVGQRIAFTPPQSCEMEGTIVGFDECGGILVKVYKCVLDMHYEQTVWVSDGPDVRILKHSKVFELVNTLIATYILIENEKSEGICYGMISSLVALGNMDEQYAAMAREKIQQRIPWPRLERYMRLWVKEG